MHVPSPVAKLLCKIVAIIVEGAYESERSKFPDCRIGALHVYGFPPFVSDVTEVLAQLERSYPYGYSLVQRYIRGIIETKMRRRNGESIQVVFVPPAADGRLRIPPNRFAANLVRYAVVWKKQFGFDLFKSRKSQLQSLTRELHAMRLLGCDQKYFHRPTNLILNLEKET